MDCLRCRAQNVDGKKFCGDCGAMLSSPEEERIRTLAKSILEEQFRLRDQKLLEIETADAIYDRLKKLATPTVLAITIAIAILGFIGYGKFNSLLDAMKVAETEGLARLRSQTDKETQHIKDEAGAERTALQASTASEAATLRREANSMRAENSKSYNELQAEVKRARAKLADAQSEIAQVMEQGTTLKDKYDTVGTQLVNLKGFSPTNNVVGLTGSSVTSGDLGQFLRIYSVGSAGPEVEQIQAKLKELGCYEGAVSGQYDALTKESVERFNRARGELFPSGVVDSTGWSMLFGPVYPAPKAPSTFQGLVSGDIRLSASGPAAPVLGAVRCD
jgi:hypothetical protein